MTGLGCIESEVASLDALLTPRAERPIDITAPGWLDNLGQPPVAATIATRAESALSALLTGYALLHCPRPTRARTPGTRWLREVAAMSSDTDRYGMGSTRAMLLARLTDAAAANNGDRPRQR